MKTTSQPLVSIITITYNHAQFIESCIHSVLEQSYENWEMIIIDDGSNDETASIISSYSIREPRITFISQKNHGIFRLSHTYNSALELCNGKYICILEGDDLWKKEKMLIQTRLMESDDKIVLAWGRVEKINGSTGEVLGILPEKMNVLDRSSFQNEPIGSIVRVLAYENPIPAVSMMIRKTILQKIGGFQQSFNLPLVDLPTILDISKEGRFYYEPQILACWREFGNQTTKTYPVEILLGRWKLITSFLEQNQSFSPLFKIRKESLDNYYKKILISAYSRSGRYKLIRKEYQAARKDYLKSIFSPGVSQILWRLRSLVGYLFSFTKGDFELFVKALGRKSYK